MIGTVPLWVMVSVVSEGWSMGPRGRPGEGDRARTLGWRRGGIFGGRRRAADGKRLLRFVEEEVFLVQDVADLLLPVGRDSQELN